MIFTFDGDWNGFYFVAENWVEIFLLAIAGDCHARSEECDVPYEDEANGHATVFAEDLHRWERAHYTNPEWNDIGQWSDCDWNGRIGHRNSHTLWNTVHLKTKCEMFIVFDSSMYSRSQINTLVWSTFFAKRPTSQMYHRCQFLLNKNNNKIVIRFFCHFVSTLEIQINLPIIRNGAAKFKPINSIPKYIQKPNAANVAIMADKFPKKPSHGFERTTSPIIHVIIL